VHRRRVGPFAAGDLFCSDMRTCHGTYECEDNRFET
jgi:hypothetical protein